MCGFIGLNYKGKKPKDYQKLMKIMSHRGPDHSAFYDDGKVLFVHNRLSIIDLSEAANQPMIDEETGNVIIYNGEIYNYKELKKEYKNINWKTSSDTEVILKLYNHLGKGFVEKLNGMFAFAILDKKKNKILLYRDRFGIKPLYYCKFGDEFVFSSEVRGILPFHKPQLNLKTVYNYLEFGLCYGKETFFKNIFSLDPAHFLEYDIKTKRLEIFEYWRVPDSEFPFEFSEKEIVDKTYYLIERAVELNLESDVEIAVSLSSGTDSTALLKFLHKFVKTMKAFTHGYDEEKYDEVRKVKQNLDLTSIDFIPVYLKKENMLKCLKEALSFFEMPIGGLPTLSAYNMMKVVRKKKIKVMLSGEGADETFGGYQYYYPAFFFDIQNDENLLEKELKHYSKNHGVEIKPFSEQYYKLLGKLQSKVAFASDGTIPRQTHTSKSLRKKFESKASNNQKRFFASKMKEVMYKDLTFRKIPKLLHFQDRAGMANGVETRVPFLDHDLVSFLYSLPPQFKIKNGENKYLLRKILKDFFETTEKRKTKHYVSTPQREWIKDPTIRDEILNTVRNGVLVKNNLIDFKRFEKDYIEYSKSPELGNSFFAWKIINLEYLLQNWIN